jgi:hypothetical protein
MKTRIVSGDLGEWGVGGIQVLINHENPIYTSPQGTYQIEISSEDPFVSVSLNQDLLPAGTRLTTSPSLVVHDQHQNYSRPSFGIYYPLTTIKYPKEGNKLAKVKAETEEMTFTFKVLGPKLFVNDALLMEFPEVSSLTFKEETTLDLKGFEAGRGGGFKSLLSRLSDLSKNSEIKLLTIRVAKQRHPHMSSDQIEKLLSKIISEIKKLIKVDKIIIDEDFSGRPLKILTELGTRNPQKCRIYNDSTTLEVNQKKTAVFKFNNRSPINFSVDCPERFKKVRFNFIEDTFIAKFENTTINGDLSFQETSTFGAKQIKSWIEISEGRYINKNRDHYAQFQLSGHNLESFSVDGKIYRGDQANQIYLHEGRPGSNSLKLKLIEKDGHEWVSQHRFKLMKSRKFYFSSTLDNYNLESRSSKFNYNYNLPTEKRMNLQLLAFLGASYGIHLNHIEDVSNPSSELIAGGSANYKRIENQIHGVYRFKIFHQGYYAPVIQLYGGVQLKDAGLPKDSIFQYPQKFSGISFGAEFYKEHLLDSQLENSSAIFVSSTKSDQTIRFIQELRLNLNQIGKVIGMKPTYIYGPTYTGWSHLRLVAGINYEIDKRSGENADAVITDRLVAYRIGLAFQY